MQEEFISLIRCPHTKKIFHTPVLSNGQAYEDQICNDPDKIAYVALKSFITAFLDKFPQYKDEQYKPEENKNPNITKKIMDQIVTASTFNKILTYEQFTLSLFTYDGLIKFIKYTNHEQLKYFIDNLKDLEEVHNPHKWKLINYIFSYRANDLEILKYIIDKGCKMVSYCPDDTWYPLHQLILNSTIDECIIFGIEAHIKEGLSLFLVNGPGESIVKNIFKKTKFNVMKQLLSMIDKTQIDFTNNVELYFNLIDTRQNLSNEEKEQLIGDILG
jgi:hypothetical protein